MKKIILDLTMSLDGFIEGENKEVDWIIFDKETGQNLSAFADEIDTVLYGRVSYESYGNYVPDESAMQSEKDFYRKVNEMQKFVFSKTLKSTTDNAILINEGTIEAINSIKKNAKKDIWLFGGAGLVSTLLNLDLIDEIRIGINPVVLGQGNPLFKEIKSRKTLKLLKTKIYKSGVVGLYYKPVKSAKAMLSNEQILLERLTQKDVEAFLTLYHAEDKHHRRLPINLNAMKIGFCKIPTERAGLV